MKRLYRVEKRGSDTTLRKARFWETGEPFEVVKRRVLRELLVSRNAFEDGYEWVTRLGPCVQCGEPTNSSIFMCASHGGK